MKERGKYQIQCMKSRSSTGVGMKIDLDYNIETMRITDPGDDESAGNGFKKPNIYESIKTQSRVTPTETVDQTTGEISKVTADVQSAKLKQLLGQIKAN
jgi:Neuraminidase (sialidase)